MVRPLSPTGYRQLPRGPPVITTRSPTDVARRSCSYILRSIYKGTLGCHVQFFIPFIVASLSISTSAAPRSFVFCFLFFDRPYKLFQCGHLLFILLLWFYYFLRRLLSRRWLVIKVDGRRSLASHSTCDSVPTKATARSVQTIAPLVYFTTHGATKLHQRYVEWEIPCDSS